MIFSKRLIHLSAASLSLLLCLGLSSCTGQNGNAQHGIDQQQKIIRTLSKSDIVYLGETHDSLADHQAQLEIIKKLYQNQKKIAIALEMFQRPYQEFLDRYLAGEITETELKTKTEYDQRWGFDWEYYAPILRFAKEKKLPLIALNTPTEISRKVSREGLDELTAAERQFIPPTAEIDLSNPEYRQMLLKIYQQHNHAGHGNSKGFDNFLLVQVLWDETMAERVAQFHQKNPQYKIVVLAGKGHIIYSYGIPQRVARRLQNNNFQQTSVLLGDITEIEFREGKTPADYFWQYELNK